MAQAFGVALEHHPEALAILETQYAEGEFNEARRRMTRVPAGGTLIHNPVSKAPGFQIENVFVMAGVPMIMKEMFEGIRDRLVGGAPMLTRTIASGLAEGQIAGKLGDLQARWPEIDMGSYPYYRAGRFGVAIVLRGTEEGELEAAAEAVEALMRELGAEPVREQT